MILADYIGIFVRMIPLAEMDENNKISFVLVAIAILVLFISIKTFVERYKRCPPGKVLVIYGKTGKDTVKCITKGATFVWPLVQSYDYLDLAPFEVPIDLPNALTQENVRISVPATVSLAVSNQPGIVDNAAIRLLGETTEQIKAQAQEIIIGQMRAVIATMTVDEINRGRQAFIAKLNEAVSAEMAKIGLDVARIDVLNVESYGKIG